LKVALIILALAIVPPTASTQDSTMFRGDPAHSGLQPSAPVRQFTRVKWKFLTQGRIYSSPALAAGILYFGSTDHYLYAVDAQTGVAKWKFAAGSGITSSPAVSQGAVFFSSYDGNVYSVDVATGKLLWKFKTEGEHRYTATHLHGQQPAAEAMPDPFDCYLSSPVPLNGSLYIGSGDGNIYALEQGTGKVLWKFKTGDVVHATPAIANGTVFVGSWDSYFYALDALTGALKWRYKTGEDPNIHNQVGIQSSAAIADGIVYFGCRDSNLYALDAATGEKRWIFNNKGSWVIGSPALANGRVYFSTSDSGLLYSLDAKTGTPVFSMKFLWPMFSSPAIAGDMLYIGSHEGKLIAIDLKTQSKAWLFQTEGSQKKGPAFTKPDGSPNYEAAFSDDFYDDLIVGVHKLLSVGAILSSPIVSGQVIYFGSSDGNLYAII
jgi:eukaryotic-like serine/threonine-protein kinase